jgi:methylthioribulose 1-phosphate dehydratase/enolase-phosphatase E1
MLIIRDVIGLVQLMILVWATCLQGHIWRVGYENGELKGVVFDDVPEALAEWHARGTKTYIYSSGSREAQKLIFGNTNFGDLRVYLSGFFDTTIGYVSQH